MRRARTSSSSSRADQRKDQFLATLAHELRNPLAPIRNALNLLRLADPRQPSALVSDIMERQVEHMARLVDDLIDVSRITRGKIELRREIVDVAAVITASLETSRPLIELAGHELAVTLPDEALTLDADPVRLAQVFANLLNNAAKYMDPGGFIAIEARRSGDETMIVVSDTGIGITAEALPTVFDMFAQANSGDSRSQGGLGIGLTLVRSLVDMHGGSVSASSDGPGKGSRFTVRLPLAKRPVVEHRERPSAPRKVRQLQRILVVDDNRDAADTMGTLLRMLGADVRTAYDGSSALDVVDVFHPDVAILDLGMPGISGFEVAKRIRARSDTRRCTLVALTGWSQDKDRRLTEAAGFDHHLIKPVDLESIQQILTAVPQTVG
jgi:CheY-like chemotaxis protein